MLANEEAQVVFVYGAYRKTIKREWLQQMFSYEFVPMADTIKS